MSKRLVTTRKQQSIIRVATMRRPRTTPTWLMDITSTRSIMRPKPQRPTRKNTAINDGARESDVGTQSQALLPRSGGKGEIMRKLLRVVEGVFFVALSFTPAVLPAIAF